MRRFTFIISTILLLSFSLISPTQTSAADTDNDLLKIYQDRRSGNQMNLETWYGGKYGGTPEESIGFGDIILLDLMEKVGGSSNENAQELEDMLKDIMSNINNTDNSNDKSYNSPSLKNLSQKSAIQGTAQLITSFYQTAPASSTDYLAYVQNNLQNKKIAQPAYADAGYGFTSLQPILPVWKSFRNVSYFFFVLGFIIYGFMIMFRIKINPQTAITIQLALPKLIVTLLLITFSYAIAGFMIDLFYVFWGIIANIFVIQGLSPKGVNFISGYSWGLLIPTLGGIAGTAKFVIADLWAILLPIPQILSTVVSVALAPLSLLLLLILLIVVLITFVKIWWMLLKSYVNIVLNIIFSPLILLGNIIPGSKSFSNWIKNIFAELSVFITTMTMFILSFRFMWQFESLWGFILKTGSPTVSSGALWVPPLLQSQALTNLGVGPNAASALSLLGLGILFMTPKIAEIVKNALQIKDLGYGSAISEAFTQPYGWLQKQPAMRAYQEESGRRSASKYLGIAEDIKGSKLVGKLPFSDFWKKQADKVTPPEVREKLNK